MSKDKTEEKTIANPEGKTVEELKEVAQTLQVQMNQEQVLLRENQAKAQNNQTKVIKMQGALEVILQLIPKEEVDKMIKEEERENHQEVENSDS